MQEMWDFFYFLITSSAYHHQEWGTVLLACVHHNIVDVSVVAIVVMFFCCRGLRINGLTQHIVYDVEDFGTLLSSSNMEHKHWQEIATHIKVKQFQYFQGYTVNKGSIPMQGTLCEAYACSSRHSIDATWECLTLTYMYIWRDSREMVFVHL